MTKIEHHVCAILIFNDRRELALQMRAANDKSFPSHWDFSAAGHIDENEDSQKAAERELFEELGISGQLKFIARESFQYPAWNSSITRELDASIYKMSHNGSFKIDPN